MAMPLARLRWLVLGLLCASTAINYIDRQALSVVLPRLREELGITSVQYGAITTVFLVAYTVAQIGAGVLVDRIGTRAGFVISVAVWSAAAVAHAFAQGAASLAALRFLLGLGEAGNWPAGTKAVAEWFPKSRRAFAMGMFDGGSAAGAILAPPLMSLLALTLGWRAAFVATGLLGFLWLLAWLAVYREPGAHPWLTPEQREEAVREVGDARRRQGSEWARMRDMLRVRQLWGLMATRMLATPVWWFYVFWLPDYLSTGRGFTLKEIGQYGWLPFLTVDLGKLAGGSLSDRLLRQGLSATLARKSVMAGGAVAMMGGLQVVEAATTPAAMAWVCVATFGFGMWSANILALHADVFPAESMGTAIGLTGTAASLGGAVFTYAVGALVDQQGYGPVFWAAGLAALVALVSLVFLVGRVEPARLAGAAGVP